MLEPLSRPVEVVGALPRFCGPTFLEESHMVKVE